MSARVIATLTVVLAGCLDAVAGSTCALHTATVLPPDTGAAIPSRLDYIAIASMADAQRPLALAGYRPSARD